MARAWLKRTFVLQAFPKQYVYIYIFVLFCFVLFFVVRNPHLYKFLSRLSRKGCRDEEGGEGGDANWSIRVTENVIKISGGIMLLFTFDGNSATVRKLVRQQE